MKVRECVSVPLWSIFFICYLLVLAGCVSKSDKLKQSYMEKGTQQMSAQELRETIVNKTLYIMAPDKSDDAVYHRDDGTMVWKVLQRPEMAAGTGEWHINNKSQYCEKYSGDWAMGTRCFSVYPGANENTIVMILESGKQSKTYIDGIYNFSVIPGNKYNL